MSIQNGFLPLDLFVVLEAHVDLRPDTAHQKALVIAHVLLGYVQEFVIEVDSLRPIVGIDKPDLHLVDE